MKAFFSSLRKEYNTFVAVDGMSKFKAMSATAVLTPFVLIMNGMDRAYWAYNKENSASQTKDSKLPSSKNSKYRAW